MRIVFACDVVGDTYGVGVAHDAGGTNGIAAACGVAAAVAVAAMLGILITEATHYTLRANARLRPSAGGRIDVRGA